MAEQIDFQAQGKIEVLDTDNPTTLEIRFEPWISLTQAKVICGEDFPPQEIDVHMGNNGIPRWLHHIASSQNKSVLHTKGDLVHYYIERGGLIDYMVDEQVVRLADAERSKEDDPFYWSMEKLENTFGFEGSL